MFKKIFIILFVFLFNFNIASAGLVNCNQNCDKNTGRCTDECTVDSLFGKAGNNPFWIDLTQKALGISGIIILCFFVYGGFRMMISGGDKKIVELSKKIMIGSFIGILIVFFAFALVKGALMILVGNKWTIYFGDTKIKE